jgi:phosphatidylglycerophosphate synthase
MVQKQMFYLIIYLKVLKQNKMNIKRWNIYHCLALLGASLAFMLWHSLWFFIAVASISFVFLFFISKNELIRLKPYGGWANRVTAIRFLAIMALAILHSNFSDLQIALWLVLLIPLDGLDGLLARSRNEKTVMGAYFDMETDVLYVCIASCILFLRNLSGYEIFVPAFFRYGFVLVLIIFRMDHLTEQRTKIGPFVAVYTFISISLAFLVPPLLRKIIIYSAIILLIISFSNSFYLLLKEKNKPHG